MSGGADLPQDIVHSLRTRTITARTLSAASGSRRSRRDPIIPGEQEVTSASRAAGTHRARESQLPVDPLQPDNMSETETSTGLLPVTGTVTATLDKREAAHTRYCLARGTNLAGDPLAPGTYTVNGLTVTVPDVVDVEDAGEDEARDPPLVDDPRRVSSRKRADPEDAHTTREEDGTIRKKTLETATLLLPEVQATVHATGDILVPDNVEAAAIQRIVDLLIDINGQSAYNVESQALGKLALHEYLVLPSDLPTPTVDVAQVGTLQAAAKFSGTYSFAVYALNKNICTDAKDAIRFATVRMEAVKWGWVDTQREIRFMPTPANYLQVVGQDSKEIMDCLGEATKVAFLIPLAAEHVFRTTGHHYLTNMGPDYLAKYSQIFKACLEPSLDKFLAPDLLFHKVLHWVTPARAWAVLAAKRSSANIPDAIKIRMSAAPAGAAIVTTTMAIVDAMATMDIGGKLERNGVANMVLLRRVYAAIKRDPPRFHKVVQAYGMPPLTAAENRELEMAKVEAAKIAPICKAYIDVMLRRSPLSRQKVLDKYVVNNPMIYMLAKKFFLKYSHTTPDKIDALFEAAITATPEAPEED